MHRAIWLVTVGVLAAALRVGAADSPERAPASRPARASSQPVRIRGRRAGDRSAGANRDDPRRPLPRARCGVRPRHEERPDDAGTISGGLQATTPTTRCSRSIHFRRATAPSPAKAAQDLPCSAVTSRDAERNRGRLDPRSVPIRAASSAWASSATTNARARGTEPHRAPSTRAADEDVPTHTIAGSATSSRYATPAAPIGDSEGTNVCKSSARPPRRP